MRVVTFYSFKGGVGRTLAVANVAHHLAMTGRRVLVVDFDLEAPGVATFSSMRPPSHQRGIIEFVNEFLDSNAAPSVSDFVYQSTLSAPGSGALWVMPAGEDTDSYMSQLSRIDWRELYARRHGYLLFEDLRKQWEHQLRPDYVLIDSRTGHTDVGGICTRQLPDEVVLMFFPNEQNLHGLERVVADIRREALPPRERRIHLKFVMANVPDLDDEDSILRSRIRDFKRRLGVEQFDATIHRYESLSLLNQSIFTVDRPRSRLAREYRSIATSIVTSNPQDSRGAVEWLGSVRTRILSGGGMLNTDDADRLDEIERAHAGESDVLRSLAETHLVLLDAHRAYALAERASSLAPNDPEALLVKSRVLERTGRNAEAARTAEIVVGLPDARTPHVREALLRLRELDPERLRAVSKTIRKDGLPIGERLLLASTLNYSTSELEIALDLCDQAPYVDGEWTKEVRTLARDVICLALIGLRRFDAAVDLFKQGTPFPPEAVHTCFNYAMAVWGATKCAPVAEFRRVLSLFDDSRDRGANYSQCMALAAAVVGDTTSVTRFLLDARRSINAIPAPTFSCCRYLTVEASTFVSDLESIEQFSRHGHPTPLVVHG